MSFPRRRDNGRKSRRSGSARCGRRQRLIVVIRLGIGRRDRVRTGEPAVEVNVATALRAKRPGGRNRRLAADRTGLLHRHP